MDGDLLLQGLIKEGMVLLMRNGWECSNPESGCVLEHDSASTTFQGFWGFIRKHRTNFLWGSMIRIIILDSIAFH